MKRLTLVFLWLVAHALPGVCQRPLYLKSVSYLDYTKVGSNQKQAGGFSAIEYNSTDSTWTVVSDHDAEKKNSHIFRIRLGNGDINEGDWSSVRKLNRWGVESYRFNGTLNRHFVAIENDNQSFIGELMGDSISLLHPAKTATQPTTRNRGIESLTFMPGSNDLWYAYESGDSKDCEKNTFTIFKRVKYNPKTRIYDFRHETAYKYPINRCSCLDTGQAFDENNGNGVAEILAAGQNQLLVLERCYNRSTGSNLIRIILAEVSEKNKRIVRKDTLFDSSYENCDVALGNLEGMTWGPRDGVDSLRTIYLISDDNNDQLQQTRLILLSEKKPDETKVVQDNSNKHTLLIERCDKLLGDQTRQADSQQAESANSVSSAQKANTSLLSALAIRIGKFLSGKHQSPRSKHDTLAFSKNGGITSRMPANLLTGDIIRIEVESPKGDTTELTLNEHFNASLKRLKTEKNRSPILRMLGFQNNSDAEAVIRSQKTDFYDRYLSDNSPYTVQLNNAKPVTLVITPNDSVWFTEVEIQRAPDDRERQNLTLTRTNVESKFFKAVFNKTKDDYRPWKHHKEYLDSLYAVYRGYAIKIDRLQLKQNLLKKAVSSCNCPKHDMSLKDIETEICVLLDQINLSQTLLCALATQIIEDNACWMRSWLWYTDGRPKLNPFGRVSVSDFNGQVNKRLAVAEAQLQMYNDFSKQNRTEKLNDLGSILKPHISDLAATIAALKTLKETGNLRIENAKSWLFTLATTDQIANKVLLYSTNARTIHWMNHYDARDEFRKMNGGHVLPERVYEKDAVHGLVHNLTSKQKISSKETVTKTELRTDLDIALAPLGKVLNSAIETISKSSEEKAEITKKDSISIIPDKTTLAGCSSEFESYLSSKVLIEWLNEQTEPPLAEITVAYESYDIADAGPIYRSQETMISESRAAVGTNIIASEIFEEGKDKPVAKDQHQTYENVRFWPFASVNYVVGSRATTIFDNTTNSFKAYTEIDNFEVFAGAKWYFGPSNVTRTRKRSKFIKDTVGRSYQKDRGNALGGKTFLFLGLGVRHKFLKNYGVGGGIDIVPGLSLSGGVNVYFDKKYELVNGIVRKDFDIARFKGFFGLAIDVNVVTHFISLF